MSDPLGLINHASAAAIGRFQKPDAASRGADGAAFKKSLMDEIGKVDELQRNAEQAIDEYATGERDDLEGVLLATAKADTAFRMLLQVRNKVMDAYEEVKQIRV